jgi:hypothetical protein
MKSIQVVSFISLLMFAAAPCSAQKASTLHMGVTPSTLYVGITPSSLHIGTTPSTLHVGITLSTLHVSVTPSTLHIGIEPSTLDISGGIYPTFVSVSPVLQSYDLFKTGPGYATLRFGGALTYLQD